MKPSAILAAQYTPVSARGGLRKVVGGFLRYVQHRDQHDREPEPVEDVDGFLRYVAHRDGAERHGRLFDRDGDAGDAERKALNDYVGRSCEGVPPRWRRDADGVFRDHEPAVYRFVLSPADARGLDLRELTRTVMAELDSRVGRDGAGPWVAAEHQNTHNPHVHIVLAARREIEPGRFRGMRLTDGRLEGMKEAAAHEIERQHEQRQLDAERMGRPLQAERDTTTPGREPVAGPVRTSAPGRGAGGVSFDAVAVAQDGLRPWRERATPGHAPQRTRPVRARAAGAALMVSTDLLAIAASYAREAGEEAERRKRERPGWGEDRDADDRRRDSHDKEFSR